MVHRLGVLEVHYSPQLLSLDRNHAQAMVCQDRRHLICAVELEGPIRVVILIIDRCDSASDLEHKLENAPGLEEPSQPRQSNSQDCVWSNVLDDRVAENEVEGGVRMAEGWRRSATDTRWAISG